MKHEFCRLNEEEYALVQFFRMLGQDAKKVLFEVVMNQAQNIEHHNNNVVVLKVKSGK